MAPQESPLPGTRPTATKEVTVDEHTISPAGDPVYAASLGYRRDDQDEHPHGCYGGYHYIGHLVEGEDGEEVEVFEPIPCRCCQLRLEYALFTQVSRRGVDLCPAKS
jgi:hypothetical protein